MDYRLTAALVCAVVFSAQGVAGAENVDSVKALDELVVTGTNNVVPQKLLPYTVSVVDS